MKLLLHTCCAPCFVMCGEVLEVDGLKPTLFWYNPNIHPWMEYKSRKEALEEFAKFKNLDLIVEENYGLREFISGIYPDFSPERCKKCYRMRLEKTASYAAEHGFDAFSTTLLISPYQNHEYIFKLCHNLQEKFGVKFLYKDFRPYFREGQKKAREYGLYMQKYCGCIFSEEERYLKK